MFETCTYNAESKKKVFQNTYFFPCGAKHANFLHVLCTLGIWLPEKSIVCVLGWGRGVLLYLNKYLCYFHFKLWH